MEGLELSTLLGLIGSDTATLEYNLAVSGKAKCVPTIDTQGGAGEMA